MLLDQGTKFSKVILLYMKAKFRLRIWYLLKKVLSRKNLGLWIDWQIHSSSSLSCLFVCLTLSLLDKCFAPMVLVLSLTPFKYIFVSNIYPCQNVKPLFCCRLDGQTPVQERQELIDTFNKDPSIFIFILSTKAGYTVISSGVCIMQNTMVKRVNRTGKK